MIPTALPIIVPAWEFETPGWYQTPPESSFKHLKPRRGSAVGPQCEKTSPVDAPDERTLLIAGWRLITGLPLRKATACKSLVRVSQPTGGALLTSRNLLGDGANLLATCEWLLRRRLREDWAVLHGVGRAQVLTWVTLVRRDTPVVKAVTSSADAAAWTLFAMYWCGFSHPAALFNESLHPPTGVVQWISQFHVDQQADHWREIQLEFARCMGTTRGDCNELVRRMLKRTGRVALLRKLCDLSVSGSITTI